MNLEFTPYAWAKLHCLRDFGDTEVGGYGISSLDNLLLIQDIGVVKQECTAVFCEFDDEGVADYLEKMSLQGFEPCQFMNIWIHTHPGSSPTPSKTDEDTFKDVMGDNSWAVMMILAKEGQTYARLRQNGPLSKISGTLDVKVDHSAPCPATTPDEWEAEYDALVSESSWGYTPQKTLGYQTTHNGRHNPSTYVSMHKLQEILTEYGVGTINELTEKQKAELAKRGYSMEELRSAQTRLFKSAAEAEAWNVTVEDWESELAGYYGGGGFAL